MRLKYFIVDGDDQLWDISHDVIEAIWNGECRQEFWQAAPDQEALILSVLCDEDLMPRICFFLKLRIEQGRVEDASRLEAYQANLLFNRRQFEHEIVQHQLIGWPVDWVRQLAVALDVPAAEIRRIGVGGPLVLADLWGMSIEKILERLEAADGV